ncbi:MAG: sn-glycerol-3-phosphate ABC transporter ATP-binding protein UgpC [Dehalococcoidia bacterium]|nr:sn-glycerol-3-phosphate ABC transporter ATP-binding protein UgpC [Dehalococcoidia bacterium]
MASVTFDDVSKHFPGGTAVRDFSLEIADREFLVLVGPSGCGKSTTLRMLAGLEEISEGTIRIGERAVNNVPARDRDIAMVFQSYALYPHMTVYDNMAFGLSLRKMPKAEIRRRVDGAAQILGIEQLLDRKPKALSGGQRQRVALGRAIVREPAVFLFDEPLSNLDAKLRVQTRAEISKLHQRLGTTFIYVTHDQVEAMTMATRIAVMNLGELQQVGTPQQLYDHPANLFVAGFMGSPAMNFFRVTTTEDNGRLRLEAAGLRLDVPREQEGRMRAYLGKEVILGVRPEDIHHSEFVPTGLANTSTVRVRVEITELMGNEIFLYLAAGGTQFLARVDPRAGVKAGSEVEVAFHMSRMHVFDTESEEAVVTAVSEIADVSEAPTSDQSTVRAG